MVIIIYRKYILSINFTKFKYFIGNSLKILLILLNSAFKKIFDFFNSFSENKKKIEQNVILKLLGLFCNIKWGVIHPLR